MTGSLYVCEAVGGGKQLVVFLLRFLTPDTSILLSELGKTTSKKYHKLNSAIATLVSWRETHSGLVAVYMYFLLTPIYYTCASMNTTILKLTT